MPNAIIKSLSDNSGIDVATIEKMWKNIKEKLIDINKYSEDDDNFYPILVSILKKQLHIKELKK